MKPRVQIWERATCCATIGLRLWDAVTATHLWDGLEIDVVARARPQSRARAFVNRSGIYCVMGLPGLRDFELGNDEDDVEIWRTALRHYRIEVRDPFDRFHSFTFNADLLIRGFLNWMAPWTSPIESLVLPTDNGSPPGSMAARIPLFSAPSREIPGTFAVVRSQLQEKETKRHAAWCLLTVSIDKVIRGVGVADKEGRVVIIFSYPERPRPVLTSPLTTINDFRWDIELAAYYVPKTEDTLASDIPDLAAILDQLNSPRTLFPQTSQLWIEYGRSLTVRSQDSSFLFVNTV
ncbi:MAG: hypothetical protein DU489_01720 [Nitrosomonas sp.]|uniref:hypothetical protein n=1 Tax=Nitrosomonas sp. TaxID=42353 RepID=UPI0032EC105A